MCNGHKLVCVTQSKNRKRPMCVMHFRNILPYFPGKNWWGCLLETPYWSETVKDRFSTLNQKNQSQNFTMVTKIYPLKNSRLTHAIFFLNVETFTYTVHIKINTHTSFVTYCLLLKIIHKKRQRLFHLNLLLFVLLSLTFLSLSFLALTFSSQYLEDYFVMILSRISLQNSH